MASAGEDAALFIGWDVGGWNCDKNNKSRDALVIIDDQRELIGKPWRGNLRHTINEAETSQQWLTMLLELCRVEEGIITSLPNTEVVLAIDTPLGFSQQFLDLLNGKAVSDDIGVSATNPYLFRQTERFLFEHGLTPLSGIKDMIGSQATKGIHVVNKFAPNIRSTGVWSDNDRLTLIEAYPAACKNSRSIAKLLEAFYLDQIIEKYPVYPVWEGAVFAHNIRHDDERDALICALIGWLFRNNFETLSHPTGNLPEIEGWIFVPQDTLDQGSIE